MAKSRRQGNLKSLAVKLLLTGASIAFGLCIGEGYCRFLVWYSPEPQNYPTYLQQAWMKRYDVRNRLGFRDPEPMPGEKPLLVVVGDSFAFGWGIERIEDRYGERLAAMLGWRSLNAASPGTHTLDHIEFVKKILPFRPAAIVLLYVFNDIHYLSPEPLPRPPPLLPLFYRSHLYQQIVVRVHHWLPGPEFRDGYMDDGILKKHAADLKTLADLAATDGAIALIVPFIRLRGDDVPFVSKPDSESQYRRLVAALREADAPVWPIDEAFAGYEREELTLNSLDVHPNELAHRLAAEATLPYFRDRSR